MGKSRLAIELLDQLRTRGYDVEWARASSGTTSIPFGAISALVPSDTTDTLWALFRLAHKALAERSNTRRRLVIGIDDVHQLDDASAALIHQAAHNGVVLPVLTARSPDPVPEPITELWKDELVDRMTLGDLTRHATDDLLDQTLGVQATALVKNRAWELSLGNPLLLRELVLMGLDTISEQVALDPSDRLLEIVASRIGDVMPDERAVLEMVAVSNPLEVSIIEALGGEDTLGLLENRQLINVFQDDRRWLAQFSHPLHGEVIRAGMPLSRRRFVNTQLAEALRVTGLRRRTDTIRAATLHLDGDLPPDPDLMTGAAADALASFAYPVAERLARAAWKAGRHPSALLILGEALSRSARGDEAESVFSDAEMASDDQVTLTRVRIARAHNLAFVMGKVLEARQIIDHALAESPTGVPAVELAVSGAWAAALGGSFQEAIRLGKQVYDDADAGDDLRLRALVISTLGQVMVGEVEDAQPYIDAGLGLAERLRASSPFSADLLETNRFMGMALTGEIEEAVSLAASRYETAVEEGAPEVIGLWAADLGFAKERRGDFKSAIRYLGEAAEISLRHDPYAIRGLAIGWAALAYAQLGKTGEFFSLADELDSTRAPEDFRTWTIAHRAAAWRPAMRGDDETAAAEAVRLGRLGIEKDFVNWAIITVYEAVRFGYPELVIDLLEEAAGTCDGRLVGAMSRHAAALKDGDAAEIESVADDFLAMGFDVYSLEAHSQARKLHKAHGDRKAASRANGKIVALQALYPNVMTPPLRDLPPLLTGRETQVARLAAQHTSPEIAAKLSISVRTVDNHLASVYTKLGIGGREELAAVLGD